MRLSQRSPQRCEAGARTDDIRKQARLGSTEGGDALENAIDQVWPQLTAPSFLRDLLGSEARLVSAAADDFSAADVRRLYRRRADRIADEVWAPNDLPLLDYADSRIAGEAGRRYAHIVVDEAHSHARSGQPCNPTSGRPSSRR